MGRTLWRRSRRCVGVTLVALATTVWGCSSSSGPARGAVAPSVASDAAAATTSTAETATSAPPTTANPWGASPPQPGSSVDKLAPVGDAQYDLTHRFSDGTEMTSHVIGMVDLPTDGFDAERGVCVGVLAEVTTHVGDPATRPYTLLAPLTSLYLDGTTIDRRAGCDDDVARQQGWTRVYNQEGFVDGSTVGLVFPFFIPEGSPPIGAILFGSSPKNGRYYEPVHLDGFPSAPPPRPGTVKNNASADAPIPMAREDRGKFDVTVQGIVRSLPLDEFSATQVGECVAVVGTITARELPALIPDLAFAPKIIVVADGQMYGEETCDDSSVEAAGYQARSDYASTIDNSFSFYRTYIVPDGAPIQSMFVSMGLEEGAAAVEPKILDAVPTAPPMGTANPVLNTVAVTTGNERTIRVEQRKLFGDDVEAMEASVLGIMDITGVNSRSPSRCVAILANVSATTDRSYYLQTGLIAAGAYRSANIWNDQEIECDGTQIEAAGYIAGENLTPTERESGTWSYRTVAVPSVDSVAAIVLGDPELPDVGLIDPVLLATVPPVPG